VRIELLYIPDCPNYALAVQTVREALRERGLPEEIVEIEVSDPAQAIALCFPGSPTIRINGQDIEPGMTECGHHGVACRTYLLEGKRQGIPQRERISQAILARPSVSSKLALQYSLKSSPAFSPTGCHR